jgi:4-diphosphocytidyl-2-C-methyl-D-erythritol kinase
MQPASLTRCDSAPGFLFKGGLRIARSANYAAWPRVNVITERHLTLPAFAKINLSLRVFAPRADRYHDLDTTLQTVSLHDTIEFSSTDQPHIVLSCSDRALSADDNLVMKAASALQTRFATRKGARIRLDKRVPMQAGLGGGSSDAAITLLGLAALWQLETSGDELSAIAAQLGADVPFFFHGGTARATGAGERIERLDDVPDRFFLVIKPNACVSTFDAYQYLDERSLTSPKSKTILSTSVAKQFFDNSSSASLTNDFETVVFERAPEIRRTHAALITAGADAALLAGSGSAVFGIFDSEDAQRRAIQAIELETGWRVFPCKTVGREQYRRAMGAAGRIVDRISSQ